MNPIFAPRSWPAWLLMVPVALLVRLPIKWQFALGSRLGRLIAALAPRRRSITETNLALCFPERSQAERSELAKRSYEALGISIMEMAMTWVGRPIEHYRNRFTLRGGELVRERLARGKGVIIVGSHFVATDITFALLQQEVTFDLFYRARAHPNPVFTHLTTRTRQRTIGAGGVLLDRDDILGIVRRLKDGHAVWYAVDQDYGPKHSVFAPFFGVPAATITVLSRLARMTDAELVYLAHYRDVETGTWRAELTAPFDEFTGDDALHDAALINRVVQEAVAKHPEQYLWAHRRFKTRPPGEPSPY